jgi:hypothetical protein
MIIEDKIMHFEGHFNLRPQVVVEKSVGVQDF